MRLCAVNVFVSLGELMTWVLLAFAVGVSKTDFLFAVLPFVPLAIPNLGVFGTRLSSLGDCKLHLNRK